MLKKKTRRMQKSASPPMTGLTSCTLGFRQISGEFSTDDSVCRSSPASVSAAPQHAANAPAFASFTSTEVGSVCVGLLGRASAFISSTRWRGGVAMKTGVTGASDWSALVGVAHGEP